MCGEGSTFVTAPELKATSLCQPLGYDSAHKRHIATHRGPPPASHKSCECLQRKFANDLAMTDLFEAKIHTPMIVLLVGEPVWDTWGVALQRA